MQSRPTPGPRADVLPRLVDVDEATRPELLCFHHGSALFLCALVMTADRDVAVETAADALVRVGLDAEWAADAHAVQTRRRLAATVRTSCRDHQPATSEQWADLPTAISVLAAGTADTARLQRDVLALCVYGAHSANQAAAVVGITTGEAYDLLRWGLRDVAAAPR